MPKPRIILWDLDGTIIDSAGIFAEIIIMLAARHGFVVPTQETIRANFHGTLEDSVSGSLGGLTPEVTTQLVTEFLEAQDEVYAEFDSHIFPDALRVMKRAHEMEAQQIIVTTRGHVGRKRASPRHIVENSVLQHYIDSVICGDDTEHRKPDVRVIASIADQLLNADVLVIGDQHVDAELARNAHSRAVLVNRDGDEPPHMATLGAWHDFVTIVPSLDDVRL